VTSLVAVTHNAEETLALATRVGGLLRGGDVVALTGDLGAGTTVFAKGVGRALGVSEPVVSPTFTVVREYACGAGNGGNSGTEPAFRSGTEPAFRSGTEPAFRSGTEPVRLVHVDVYRLDHVQELHDVGWDDYLDGDSVAVVEWGERVGALLPLDRLDVRLELADAEADDEDLDTRVITLVASGSSWVARSDALAAIVEVA
jgi:tRNA threonylcarbamoyladenosine biosynthesis protein TsaE